MHLTLILFFEGGGRSDLATHSLEKEPVFEQFLILKQISLFDTALGKPQKSSFFLVARPLSPYPPHSNIGEKRIFSP